jgi:threonine dehydrogenase-like Zn-dependent dehydrogenase
VVEAAGEPDSINLAIDLVKQWGFVLQFGVPRVHRLDFHMEEFFRKRLLWQACVGAMGDPGFLCTWMAMELIDQGIADAKTILTHRFPFEQVMEAYELQFTRDEGAVKIVVELSK